MAKQLVFEHEGKQYTLEFNRRTIAEMERNGFNISAITTRPMSTLPDLFAGAFLAHHRFVKRAAIDEIFSKMKNREELIGKLAEMYNEPIQSMLEEPEEKEGNVDWTASW